MKKIITFLMLPAFLLVATSCKDTKAAEEEKAAEELARQIDSLERELETINSDIDKLNREAKTLLDEI